MLKTFASWVSMAAVLAFAPATWAAGADEAKVKEAVDIATDAYVYGYSLMTTDVTRVQMTNVDKAGGALTGPVNQFINVPRYPPADYRGVSAPNADTLYSAAWLDLAEPQVFSHPDMGKRFHLFPMIDMWMTIFASPGTRTGDSKAAQYLLTGPDWKGEVPKGMKRIPVATRYMIILGRTYANGTEADYKAVNALQAQYKITPLASWGKPFTPKAPPVDPNPRFSMTDKPQQVILAMGTKGYFDLMTKLMCKDVPAYAADVPALARFAKIGIERRPTLPMNASSDSRIWPSTSCGRGGRSRLSSFWAEKSMLRRCPCTPKEWLSSIARSKRRLDPPSAPRNSGPCCMSRPSGSRSPSSRSGGF